MVFRAFFLPFQDTANVISVSLCTSVSAANADNLESKIETMLLQLSIKDSQDRKVIVYLPAGIMCHSEPSCYIHTVLENISAVTHH